MANASAGDVGRHLRQLFGAGSGVGLSDGQLLERFATAGRDAAEAAFFSLPQTATGEPPRPNTCAGMPWASAFSGLASGSPPTWSVIPYTGPNEAFSVSAGYAGSA